MAQGGIMLAVLQETGGGTEGNYVSCDADEWGW